MENHKTEFVLKGIETWSDMIGNREITDLVNSLDKERFKIFFDESKIYVTVKKSIPLPEPILLSQYSDIKYLNEVEIGYCEIKGEYIEASITRGNFTIKLENCLENKDDGPKCDENFEHRKYKSIDIKCCISSEGLEDQEVEDIKNALIDIYKPKSSDKQSK